MRRIAMIAISLLALAGTQGAIADDARVVQLSDKVSYGELNLRSQRGVEVLYQRLANAAKEVCSPLNAQRAHTVGAYRQCVSDALSNAIRDVDQPLLTQYHQTRTGDAALRVTSR